MPMRTQMSNKIFLSQERSKTSGAHAWPSCTIAKKKSETYTKQGGESPERLNKLFYLAI